MNETLKVIHGLRSIHFGSRFSSRDIADEHLELILSACVRAASASARQSYSIIVLDDRELMKELCGYKGSRALVFCVDFTRIIDTAEHMNRTYVVDGIVPFVTGSIDTILAAQTAAIAARSLGIDSLFTNGIHYRGNIPKAYELLGLPKKYCFPLITLILGHPVKEPDHLRGRLSGPGIVHYGTYRRATSEDLDEIVQKHDAPENHMVLNENWKRQGFNHYLDWYFTEWFPARERSSAKSQMFQVLEEVGFLENDKEDTQ